MDHISTFRIPIERIPQAKDWKVGGKYKILAQVEQTGITKERHYPDSERLAPLGSKRPEKKHYRTMVEFKVYDVSAAKSDALKKRY